MDSREHKKKFNRVDVQVFIMTIVIVVISCSLIFLINYGLSYNNMIMDLKHRSTNLHDYLEKYLDADMFSELNVKEDDGLILYQNSRLRLEGARNAAGVRYLYTAKVTDKGQFIYLVDGLPTDSPDFRYVGDPIEAECIPDMKRALSGETVFPNEINKTTWGPVFISYFPMHDGDKVIEVLGIEFDATSQYNTYRLMKITTPIVLLLSCIAAAVVAVLMFRRISNPLYKDLSNTDMLTGLKNRNAFEVDLHNWDQYEGKKELAILSFDLDRLKDVNDIYGHAKGDEYLILGSSIIGEALYGKYVLYRIGGDEFVAVIQNGKPEEVDGMFREIGVMAEQESKNQGFEVSISSGYAFYDPEQDKKLADTLRRSDAWMYRNKRKREYGIWEKEDRKKEDLIGEGKENDNREEKSSEEDS
ncbi:GGDEF domain-containing protein [Eisenbergiella tayi]|uniref:Cyclic di-GMP phosphodiesterase Gmr n=1 Tax=Eisenbergiella tayi TaxID=1432052 RepID=A0A1E3A850_9FIRM|nr:GGDEF domain-containing protein [Eisenbergiella tayi]ODM04396.1 Cyclic di-GMP phosphodiesterase Gmr [Eisenbergiella tayi]